MSGMPYNMMTNVLRPAVNAMGRIADAIQELAKQTAREADVSEEVLRMTKEHEVAMLKNEAEMREQIANMGGLRDLMEGYGPGGGPSQQD